MSHRRPHGLLPGLQLDAPGVGYSVAKLCGLALPTMLRLSCHREITTSATLSEATRIAEEYSSGFLRYGLRSEKPGQTP
jgi:hypothetical protein